MEILNEKETVIFKSAETLLNVSTSLREINPDVAQAVLFLSDRLLKAVELEPVTVESAAVELVNVCNDELCPDCGGIKQVQHIVCNDELCPDCGGIKQDDIVILDQKESVDESTNCHGHQADGTGTGQTQSQMNKQGPNNHVSSNIKNEIQEMINEIRGTL
jgi:hypothetical protein